MLRLSALSKVFSKSIISPSAIKASSGNFLEILSKPNSKRFNFLTKLPE